MGHNENHHPPPYTDDGDRPGTWVMGTPVTPHAQQPATWVPGDSTTSSSNAYYMNHSAPSASVGYHPPTNNPYVYTSPSTGSCSSRMETAMNALNRWGKKLEVTTRKAEGFAGNVWHHLKTGPSVTDAALARMAQGTKVLAEGGHEKVFRQRFEILAGEELRKSYACYLSTSSGPVIGTLYISTARLAFCSDNPLCYTSSPGHQEWIYYKVMVQLDQLRAVNPSANRSNPAEKFIQIVTADGHEFWFMGFVSYDKALKNLGEALHHVSSAHSR
eukprot:TRINITY_DN16097_c0_g1_i1.p1 TRINITY_DN16097_c0_g1~~TRINITY_DN16097_c0_g1_i1.p1  ORF type:complete len:273 (+),score=27.11 TRINITY_DN16097_c0_g1_i1:164-982(+)